MTRRFGWPFALVFLLGCFCLATPLLGQSGWPDYPSLGRHAIERGPGNYFSWIKLALIIAVFLVWVRVADWINRDAIRFSRHTGFVPQLWNPVIVLSFVAGLLAVLSIPVFVGGYAAFCAGAFFPLTLYLVQRRGRIPPEAKTGELFAEKIEQTSLPIEVVAAGENTEQAQSNLIRARQSESFEPALQMLHDAVSKRTEQILLDYTREAVAGRSQIDGIWQPLPALDRASGDALLVVLKTLANLNPAERRQPQRGQFRGQSGRKTFEIDLTSQGVPTGERVLLKIHFDETLALNLANLGMQPAMLKQLNACLEEPGLIIISAPAGQGLSATWQAVLNEADRFTRDFVAVIDHDERETERENIEGVRFDSRIGETPASRLKKIILKQPNVFVVPDPVDAATLDVLTDQVLSEQRMLITRTRAGSAAEALLRVMALSGDRQAFVKSVTAVTCQRLLRRLCDRCKQPIQANPQAIRQLGGNPETGTTIYRSFQLPPPEQRVDGEGRPVEMQPCPDCAGIGFVGRTAIYELVLVDDEIRQQLVREPRLEPVTRVIRQRGNLTLLEQAYRAILDGRTALSEVQRVMQAKR